MIGLAPVASSTPSVDRLNFGFNRAVDVLLATYLAYFVYEFPVYPIPAIGVVAWALLTAVHLLGQLDMARRIALPPSWPYLSAGLLYTVAILDCVGATSPASFNTLLGSMPVASLGAGAVLMTYAPRRSTRFMMVSLAGLLAIAIVDQTVWLPEFDQILAIRLLALGLTALPTIVGVRVVRAFRAMLEFQSDLSLAQAATSAERGAFGLLESEQLTALDHAAEKLLDEVASGSRSLPLDSGSAELASRIASQLRVLLVAGRARTWLHHALSDSSVVGALTTVDDPDGYAALLAPDQRDGLLTAIWLFAGDATRQAESITVRVRRADETTAGSPHRLSIELELAGVTKRRLDPAAWQAISRVGRHSDSKGPSGLTIAVDCPVDLMADR